MKATLIYNPSAGMRGDRSPLEMGIQVLRQAGWETELCETNAKGDASKFARTAADAGSGAIFAVGGDGTINEVLNGMVDSETALGVVPLGTANVWARELGLPTGDIPRALELQAKAPTARIDVGMAQGENFGPRAFLLWCGFGFDAQITAAIEPQRALKRRFGPALFGAVGVGSSFTYRGQRVNITLDDISFERRVLMGLVSNAQLYAGLVRFSPDARLDDGKLDLALFLGEGFFDTAFHLLRIIFVRHTSAPAVEHYRFREMEIKAELPVHLDAEPVGATPLRITLRPSALRILVPSTANRALFSRPIPETAIA